MKIRITLLFIMLGIASCQSGHVTKSNVDTVHAPKGQPPDPLSANFKFSFYISATGQNSKPSDSWTLDTTGTMTVRTSHQTSHGKYQDLNALAVLDPKDLDSLRMLIRTGKLYAIDSNDLTQQCAGDEHYIVKIVPLVATQALEANFDACAADYNLLLEPQRRYFRKFIDWWDRMRVKYRPTQAE